MANPIIFTDSAASKVSELIAEEGNDKEDLSGAQFVIRNPNATTTCGCGSSFSAWKFKGDWAVALVS